MYKEILQGIEGIDIYPIISLVIFVAFFLTASIWIVKLDRNYIKEMENLPLDNSDKIDN